MHVCVRGHIRELRQNSNLVIYDVNIYLERIIAQLVKVSVELAISIWIVNANFVLKKQVHWQIRTF